MLLDSEQTNLMHYTGSTTVYRSSSPLPLSASYYGFGNLFTLLYNLLMFRSLVMIFKFQQIYSESKIIMQCM